MGQDSNGIRKAVKVNALPEGRRDRAPLLERPVDPHCGLAALHAVLTVLSALDLMD